MVVGGHEKSKLKVCALSPTAQSFSSQVRVQGLGCRATFRSSNDSSRLSTGTRASKAVVPVERAAFAILAICTTVVTVIQQCEYCKRQLPGKKKKPQ